MTRADVDAWADRAGLELLVADGMDDAIVGIGQRFTSVFVVYDRTKAIACLVRDGMDAEEAEEWFEYNTVGAWVGEATPCFLITTIDG